jgi:signal transduction histidine kinase
MSANHDATAAAVDADLYLRKPVDAETLVRAVEGVLNAREHRLDHAKLAQTERLAAMGTLAAGLAHEINNPLTYVLLQLARAMRLVDSLELSPTGSDLAAALRSAREGAERIRGITSAIRVFTDPEADAMSINPIDVRAPVKAALDVAMHAIRDRAALTMVLPEPAFVIANEGQLAQVFLNLLTNATQAIPQGDPEHHEIRVAVIPGGDRVAIEVADTGVGIPAGLVGRVFEPFFTTKPVGEGTGLGLSISHNIIAAFAGTIAVTSSVGHGSTFRVELPAAVTQ